jgi:tubulin polyglutamylase TTLL5
LTQDVNDIPPKEQMVASVYIDNPLLIDGYKFDLRVYVALASINPLRIYMYEDGLARFAT